MVHIFTKLFKRVNQNEGKKGTILCGCYKVSDEDVKEAIKKGANTFEEIQAITKLGTGCGKCVPSNKAFVNKLLLKKKIDENQVVCGCFQVTAKEVEQAIKNGAKTFEEVQAITKIGTGCGHCIEGNRALVKYLLSMNH